MRALAVVDLGFGDACKGSTVDYLCREHDAELVVFFNGGWQRGHNVVLKDGTHHTFGQFGSGTFAGARTFHSRFSMVEPFALLGEGAELYSKGVPDPFGLVTIDSHCPITTPFHIAANRLRELARGENRHGSCGKGIGETASDLKGGRGVSAVSLDWGGLEGLLAAVQRRKLNELMSGLEEWPWPITEAVQQELNVLMDPDEPRRCAETYKAFANLVTITNNYDLPQHDVVVFEGSQGVLLDEKYGFHPHTTWSDCTFGGVTQILAPYGVPCVRIGVTRAYATRHGNGPFPTADPNLVFPGEHNTTDDWQGTFRRGHTDLVLLRYAVEACEGVDMLAVTCLDQITYPWQVCFQYDGRVDRIPLTRTNDLGRQEAFGITLGYVEPIYAPCNDTSALLGEFAMAAEAPVNIESWGPRASDKRCYVDIL